MSLTNMVIMPGSDYQAACDAIREKTGTTDLIKSGEMASAIAGIKAGGGSGWTADDIGHFYFYGQFVGSCAFINGMTWREFCDSIFNTGIMEYNQAIVTPLFTTEDGDNWVYTTFGPVADVNNNEADDNPDFDPYDLADCLIVDNYVYFIESDGS